MVHPRKEKLGSFNSTVVEKRNKQHGVHYYFIEAPIQLLHRGGNEVIQQPGPSKPWSLSDLVECLEVMPRARRRRQAARCRNPPMTANPGCDDDALPHSFPATEMNKDHSLLDAPPIPSTETTQEQEQEQNPLGSLPEGPLIEILSRVPYRSLCRFKCVSKPWLALCSDPDIRKRYPQTLSGFFFNDSGCSSFLNLSGRGPPMVDPSLPFLRKIYDGFEVKKCSGGLLLCECWQYDDHKFDHVVCNPMTGQWVVLPLIPLAESGDPFVYLDSTRMFLGFDDAILSGFTVFMLLHGVDDSFAKMAIYSSNTRRWTTVQIEVMGLGITECVFLNGTMHLATDWASIFTIDTKGEVWGNVDMPEHNGDCKLSIGQSQGRLHAWRIDSYNYSQLCVWVLEDYASEKWTLKHTSTVSELFGRQRGKDDRSYTAFAIHPDRNCIFLADKGAMAVSYDMDNQEVNVICISQKFKDVLPYTPCFAEPLDGH